MSLLAVGVSHRTAPVGLLEQVALDAASATALRDDVAAAPHVAEALVLSTCNRLEVYVDVEPPHRGALDLAALVAQRTGVALDVLVPHLDVHEGDDVVRHLFALVCGLDSMVVGEAQVLGQVRAALRSAQDDGCVGRSLNDLVQQALRVGKRAHAETGIDQAGPSMVSAALDVAAGRLGGLAGRRAVVVGAGSMGGLALALLRRAGVDDVVVTGRTPRRVRRLADSAGARAVDMSALPDVLGPADVLVSCTGAAGVVVGADLVRAARVRTAAGTPVADELVCLDLALPHDVDPSVEAIPGVTLVGIADLAEIVRRTDDSLERDLADVRRIVADELSATLAQRRADRATPTVVALRERAAEIAEAELARLDALGLDPDVRAEAARTVRRLVSALLHPPTLRMRELAAGDEHDAAVLREIVDVTLGEVEAVTRAHLAGQGGAA